MVLGEFEEHCRKLSESSNYGYDEQFDDLSQVVGVRVVGLTQIHDFRSTRPQLCSTFVSGVC